MSDSDSDELLLSNTDNTFPNQTQVYAKGPHGVSNLSNFNFRDHTMYGRSSTVKSSYPASVCDPSSYRRDTSTTSFRNASRMPVTALDRDRGGGPRSSNQSWLSVRGTQSVYGPRGVSPSRSMGYGRSQSPSRSIYNGRGASPTMSMRSFSTVDTNATSMSARDIVNALENTKFSKDEFKRLRDVFNKKFKINTRRKVEKRRKLRQFLKGARRKSGGESGDISHQSDSSISSDDRGSYRSSQTAISSVRSTKTNYTDIRKVMSDRNLYRDRTSDFQHSTYKSDKNLHPSGFNTQNDSHTAPPPISQRNFNSSLMPQIDKYARIARDSSRMLDAIIDGCDNSIRSQKSGYSSQLNSSKMTQKERLQNGFQLPSQRFKPTHSLPSTSRPRVLQSVDEDSILTADMRPRPDSLSSTSDNDDICSENVAVQIHREEQRKRILENEEDDDLIVPNGKRSKFPSPRKTNAKSKPLTPKQTKSTNDEGNSKDFVFAKPQFPVSRLVKAKNSLPTPRSTSKSPKQAQNVTKQLQKSINPKNTKKTENRLPEILVSSELPADILISKCAQPLDIPEPDNVPVSETIPQPPEVCEQSAITQNTTNVSMRPSFLKRKLFTQKVDMPDKNSSSDSLQSASPSNVYSAIQKEKNRTRKIGSQSCLSRDILGDESNYLDLIDKIVPLDRINITSATNRSEMQTSKPSSKTASDTANNWDFTNVVTASKDDGNISDSYTDEEIFNNTVLAGKENTTQKVYEQEDNNNENSAKQNGKTKTVQYSAKQTDTTQTKQSQTQVRMEPKCPAQIQDDKVAKKLNPKDSGSQISKPTSSRKQPQNKHSVISPAENEENLGFSKKVLDGVKLFWDSDFESDFESPQKTDESRNVDKVSTENLATNKSKVFLTNAAILNSTHSKGVYKERNENLFDKVPRVTIKDCKANGQLVSGSNKKSVSKTVTNKNDLMLQENTPEKVKSVTNQSKSKKTELSEKENKVPNSISNKTLQKQMSNELVQKDKVSDSRVVNKKGKTLKVNNNTIRFQSNYNNQADKCVHDSSDSHYLSLRSRDVDLSSLISDSNTDKPTTKNTEKSSENTKKVSTKSTAKSAATNTVKTTSKNTVKPSKNTENRTSKNPQGQTNDIGKPASKNAMKKATSKNNLKELISNEKFELSDLSFTLPSDQTRRYFMDTTNHNQSRKRKSDVSLTLLDKTMTKSSKAVCRDRRPSFKSNLNVSREILSLQAVSRSMMPSARKRRPIRPKPYIMQY